MKTPLGAIESALERLVVPRLKTTGFVGAMPHFRRVDENGVDLLSFRFYSREAGFNVEISACSRNGVVTNWGEHIAPTEVTAKDLRPDLRSQLPPKSGLAAGDLFRYEEGHLEACALAVIASLPDAEAWWAGMRQSPRRIDSADPGAS